MSEFLVAGKLANWIERNNAILGGVALGLVFLSMIIATLYFAPRMDLSRLEANVAKIQSDVALIKQDTAAIKRTQEEHGERLINIEQQMGYMYNRLNGIDDRFNVHMSEMHVLGERVNKNEKDIIRIQNAR